MAQRNCATECSEDSFGNCTILGNDGLPLQCVGSWVEDKYFFLERYLNSSCEARRLFSNKGNAVYLDLFAGPGRCIIRGDNREIDSGGTRATNRNEAAFNEFYFFDNHESNADALKKRLKKELNSSVRLGDSNILVPEVVKNLLLKPYRYHFAFIDPFGPDGLKFSTLTELAKLQRMDMLIHFPIGAIKRNLPQWLKTGSVILDDYLGTSDWRDKINKKQNIEDIIVIVFILLIGLML